MAKGLTLGLWARGLQPTDRGHGTGRPWLTDWPRGPRWTGTDLVWAWWARDSLRTGRRTGTRWVPDRGRWSPRNSGGRGWNRIPSCTELTARNSSSMSENTAPRGKTSIRTTMEAAICNRICFCVGCMHKQKTWKKTCSSMNTDVVPPKNNPPNYIVKKSFKIEPKK